MPCEREQEEPEIIEEGGIEKEAKEKRNAESLQSNERYEEETNASRKR